MTLPITCPQSETQQSLLEEWDISGNDRHDEHEGKGTTLASTLPLLYSDWQSAFHFSGRVDGLQISQTLQDG